MDRVAFFSELVKLGAISDAQAQESINRLDLLEKQKPTVGQVARYGAIGAGAGALTRSISHGVETGGLPKLRGLGGAAAAGAVGMGLTPLIQSHLNRRAEAGTLKKYLAQEHAGKFSKNPEPEGAPAKFENGVVGAPQAQAI
jgi:hypothetical protein